MAAEDFGSDTLADQLRAALAGTPKPATDPNQDHRIEAVARRRLFDDQGSGMDADQNWRGYDLDATGLVTAADGADAEAGIQRVDMWLLRCIACERQYNAQGVACYIDRDNAPHCELAVERAAGGVS